MDSVELWRRILDSRCAEIETSGPGIIKSYDSAKRVAEVQPGVKRVISDEDDIPVYEELPIVQAVVLFPGADGFGITWPVAKDSVGLLVTLRRSITEWRDSNGAKPVEPADQRMHHLEAAVFLPAFALTDGASTPATAQNALVLTAATLLLGAHDATDQVTNDTKLQLELVKIKGILSTAVKSDLTPVATYTIGATGFPNIKGK